MLNVTIHIFEDKIDLNWGSRQEEMRLAALVAAKETVVQKNADAIKVFRFVVYNRMLCLIPLYLSVPQKHNSDKCRLQRGNG